MSDATYPIHEVFHSFQGEGIHLGRNAFFIRLFGCPVHCSWCDSAGTWHPKHIPFHIERWTAGGLAMAAQKSGAPFAVITGGEPMIHELEPLLRELSHRRIGAHVETCGAFPKGHESIGWITVSPKRDRLPTVPMLLAAHEIKLIIDRPGAVGEWERCLHQIEPQWSNRPVWLHPEWSQRENPVILAEITEAVKGSPRYRAGWQTHKLYRADTLDSRSAPSVPLGGVGGASC